MRKFTLAVSVAMLMDTSFAGHLMAFQDSYVTPFGAYRTVVRGGPPPCGRLLSHCYVWARKSSLRFAARAIAEQPAKWCEIIKSN